MALGCGHLSFLLLARIIAPKPNIYKLVQPQLGRCSNIRNMSSSTGAHPNQVQSSGDISEDSKQPTTTGPGLLKILEQSPKRLKRIKFLGQLFQTHGFELRIAGGAVRDILRNKEPHDIDFATTARPEQSLEIVSKHEDVLRIIVTASGQKHGTVAVKFKEVEIDFKKIKLDTNEEAKATEDKEPEYDEESPYEITTLRCDKLTDGRHAEVEFINDWKVDAERRDLTINAMFLTLDDGRLIDYFNGESDLREGVVKFVGDADRRIKEDYLRILRYFRFWSRYGRSRQPDQETLNKLSSNLEGLKQISGERIWQELKKTFSYLPCLEVVELMLKLKLFNYAGLQDDHFDQEYEQYSQTVLNELKVVQTNVQKYCDEILDARLSEDPDSLEWKKLKELLPVILFATAVRTDELCLSAYKRAKFSNLERDTILFILENREKNPKLSAFKYQLAMSPEPERLQTLQRIRAYLIFKGQFDHIEQLEQWPIPKFPMSGHILAKKMREKKLPGAYTKHILDSLKFEWAKSDYTMTLDQLIESAQVKVDELVETKRNEANKKEDK